MSHYLFLTFRMELGYGVDVVIGNVARNLMAWGHQVTIGCLKTDGHYHDLDIRRVYPDPENIGSLVTALGCDCVVAHTSPFFEVLPLLSPAIRTWVWEHGDPSPALFSVDSAERHAVKEAKIRDCYPAVTGVIAISHFIRADIRWPAAVVIHNGCDHVPDLGTKGAFDFNPAATAPLRVGTLMRLGQEESHYKGNRLFLEVVARCTAQGVPAHFMAMGRGTAEDAAFFAAKGIETHLNAPDGMKWEYLRGLDVFISPSLWEGFNLPLVEAQALGTMGVAFDTGAHPEVTPFVVSSVDEVVALLKRLAADRPLLQRHSMLSYRFVRGRFGWERCAQAFLRVTGPGAAVRPQSLRARFVWLKSTLGRMVTEFIQTIRLRGWKYAFSKVTEFCARKFRCWQRSG